MPSIWPQRKGPVPPAPAERKSFTLFSLSELGADQVPAKGSVALTREGVMRNPIVYRCVRLIAGNAARVRFQVREQGQRLTDHPLLELLARPNSRSSGQQWLEEVYTHLLISGNAYIRAVLDQGQVRGLFTLRPDRMRVIAGKDGWPEAYAYAAGNASQRFSLSTEPVPQILHLRLFHPLDDHYGLSPLSAAQTGIEIHNAAAAWNRALLENAARPSGALVYSGETGSLTADQFERLKSELENTFQGASNAGRPLVLEGGLDWKTMALSPREMDFIEAKHAAAREIALALGVPPMLLGLPGDNTFANYAEANKALWRQTVVPLVTQVAQGLGNWLAPALGGSPELEARLEEIEALAEDRNALWARVGQADFLSDDEKRSLLGIASPETGKPPRPAN